MVDRELAHRFKRDDFQSALVRGLKNDAWSHVVLVSLLPARGAKTPAVSEFETGETVLRHGGRKVVAGEFGELRELSCQFHTYGADVAERLADAMTKHATPVGSGTVARTQRIPIKRRAESAMIAWLRHGTTAYNNMKIVRVKGKRRKVRRMLAKQSRRLLEGYRAGDVVHAEECPLQRALCENGGYTGNDVKKESPEP